MKSRNDREQEHLSQAGYVASRAVRFGRLAAGLGVLAPFATAQTVLHEWTGPHSSFALGYSMASVGDVDGGGKDDLLIGSGDSGGQGKGAAFLRRGEDGSIFAEFGGEPSNFRGSDVAGAGDLDGDGRPDLLIGSHTPNNAGKIEALSYQAASGTWKTLWTHTGTTAEDLIYRVRPMADVNGGGPDVLIGGYGVNGNTGVVKLLDGKTGTTIRSWHGSQANASFGVHFDGCDDIDNDTIPDVVIAASRFDISAGDDAGRIYVYSGGKDDHLIRIINGQAGENLGGPLRIGSDIDGDGFRDILAGARMIDPYPQNDGAGRAYALSTKTGATLMTWNGAAKNDRFGFIGPIGDVNGDGAADIAIGSQFFDPAGHTDAGRLEVFSGRDLSRRLVAIDGNQAGEWCGAIDGGPGAIDAGDVNGDGYDDFAVASFHFDAPTGGDAGRVRVFAGDVFTPGVSKYGASSYACSGLPIPLSVTSAPTPGNPDFAITCKNVPAGSVALPVIGIATLNLHVGPITLLVNLSPGIVGPLLAPSPAGMIEMPAVPPAGYPGGIAYFQFLMVDVAGFCGPISNLHGASNALNL